jgi:hypothetical protein
VERSPWHPLGDMRRQRSVSRGEASSADGRRKSAANEPAQAGSVPRRAKRAEAIAVKYPRYPHSGRRRANGRSHVAKPTSYDDAVVAPSAPHGGLASVERPGEVAHT